MMYLFLHSMEKSFLKRERKEENKSGLLGKLTNICAAGIPHHIAFNAIIPGRSKEGSIDLGSVLQQVSFKGEYQDLIVKNLVCSPGRIKI